MEDPEPLEALVVGAGPAGLMAAEALAVAGRRVTVCEGRPSAGRKLLMAGKSGLNVTKDEGAAAFAAAYAPPDWLRPMLAAFGPAQVMDWCRGLGQPVFTGSSGRVFPVAMKASPLLRAWMARLAGQGVTVRTRWHWTGFASGAMAFDTPDGPRRLAPRVTVLALGGASWSRLGSDGAWAPRLQQAGVGVAPFRPANGGLAVRWSPPMARHFGQAVKGARLAAGALSSRGEFVVSARGLEGGGIYAVFAAVRDGAALSVDLLPDVAEAAVARRLSAMRAGESLSNRLRKLGLAPAAAALVLEFGRGLDPLRAVKALPLAHAGPRPIDEAISTAGGITREALTGGLELRARPGTFACGEMLDWEAPTGGYLLTGCWATGLWAGRHAAGEGPPA